MSALKQYIDLYNEHRTTIEAHAPAVLNAHREAALKALDGATLPRKGSENYEVTDLEEVYSTDYGVNINRVAFTADPAEAFRCDVPNMSTCQYYFFNDSVSASRTATLGQNPEVLIEPMSALSAKGEQIMQQHYGSLAKLDNATVALNTLLAQDGLLIYVPRTVEATRPIQLLNILNAAAPVMAVRRVLIVLEEAARASVVLTDFTQSTAVSYLDSLVVEIVAGKDSKLDYYDVEENANGTHRVASVFVKQSQGCNVMVNGMTLTNGFTRNDYTIYVDGEGCETRLMGLTIADGKQHSDTHSLIAHNAPRCKSNELFKYVLNDEAQGAFSGKILVQPGCPRIDAYQSNRNICASPTARMHTKPQLEIYTDDVKCSHGSTIGQLDEEALFYMRTRGIGIAEARMLLMQAFMADVVDSIELDVLRDRMRHLVEKRFIGTLAQCNECAAGGTCRNKIADEAKQD